MVNIKPLMGPTSPDSVRPLDDDDIKKVAPGSLSPEEDEDYVKKSPEKPEIKKKGFFAKALARLNILSR